MIQVVLTQLLDGGLESVNNGGEEGPADHRRLGINVGRSALVAQLDQVVLAVHLFVVRFLPQ